MANIKGSDRLSAEVLTLTPQAAGDWLKTSLRNRNISRVRVEAYRRTMADGHWRITQPLMRDSEKRMIDGHHRLHAVIVHGSPIEFLVITGYDADDVFALLDRGYERKLAHWLQEKGYPHSQVLATVIGYAYRDERQTIPTASQSRLAPYEGIEYLELHPELADTVSKCPAMVNGLAPATMMAWCFHAFRKKDESLAREFLIDLVMGEDQPGDPVTMLRLRLKANRRASKKMDRTEMLALFYKAWNAERTGQKVQVLMWRTSERFPEVW